MKAKTHMKYGLVWLGTLLIAGAAHAATLVTYTATADPNADGPDGYQNGDPLDTVDVWQMTLPGGPPSTGSFFLGAPDITWASYSTTSATGIALAQHTFVGGALTVGQGIEIGFANQNISSGKQIGIRLEDSVGASVFTLFFEGGDANYSYIDSSPTVGDTGQVWLYENFFDFSFNLTSATTYDATFGSGSFSGTVANLPIARIVVFNDAMEGAGSVFFRDLSVVPEPSSALLLASAVGVMALLRRRRSAR